MIRCQPAARSSEGEPGPAAEAWGGRGNGSRGQTGGSIRRAWQQMLLRSQPLHGHVVGASRASSKTREDFVEWHLEKELRGL